MGSDTEAEKKKTPVALAPIAKPLAGKKLCKRTLKLVRRASEAKCLKRGVKEVVKSIRRGNKGLCVIAGNISPIDVITHVPILCEEANIPYVYVPSKEIGSIGVDQVLVAYMVPHKTMPTAMIASTTGVVKASVVKTIYYCRNKLPFAPGANIKFPLKTDKDLATAGTTKRPTCCVLVLTKPAKGELEEEAKEKLKTDYDQVLSEVAEVTSSMF